MKTVAIIKPILVDGVWHREGVIDIPDALADDYEAKGWVDIAAQDGAPVIWPACCGDH